MMTTAPWFIVSLAVFSTALLLAWQSLEKRDSDSSLRQRLAVPWLRSVAALAYFVGLPYLALILGLLTPGSLGLRGLEHFALIDLSSSALVVQLQRAVTLMLLEWLLDSSVAILVGLFALLLLAVIQLSLTRRRVEITLIRERALLTVYLGLHWAFYRAIFWTLTDDLYLGVVLGAAYVMVEWGLATWLLKVWAAPEPRWLVGSMVLILTSAIFYYSPNLWFLLLIHIAMMAIVNRVWGDVPGPELSTGSSMLQP